MLYDLFADFYAKSSDRTPIYVCEMGTYSPKTINEMESLGFQVDPSSTQGYLDYIKDATEEDVMELSQPGFICEIFDVLETDFEVIKIRAQEVEVIDDDGNHPIKGTMLTNAFVCHSDNEPFSLVDFYDNKDFPPTSEALLFSLPVFWLKKHFNAQTMMLALECLIELDKEKKWSHEDMKDFFTQAVLLEVDEQKKPEVMKQLSQGYPLWKVAEAVVRERIEG